MVRDQKQKAAAQAIQPQGGLGQLMAQQGASPTMLKDVAEVEGMPGGMELLYTVAAEELMNKAGVPKKDSKKVRLYKYGGAVERAYAQGGDVKAAAATTRAAGRGDDSMMLHVSPEEYEVITSMWGEPEVNPNTGIGEYGFLSKLWKKVKKTVKKIVKSKLFQIVAPIALSIFAPGLGTAIGGMLGAGSGATASIIGNAVVRGGLSAAGGGDWKSAALSGAISGGLGAAAGKGVSAGLEKIAPGLEVSQRTADVIGSGLAGGAAAELGGGEFMQGAIQGGLGEYMRPTVEGLTKKGQDIFGVETTPGKILAQRTDPGTQAMSAIASGEAMYDPSTGAYVTDPSASQIDLAASMTPGASTAPSPAAETPAATTIGGGLKDFALPALLAAGMAGSSEYEEPVQPELPESFNESLPLYSMNRSFSGMDPNAYYSYGQAGAPQSGQNLFLQAEPFGSDETPINPTGGLGTGAVPGGPGAQPIPVKSGLGGMTQRAVLQAQGWTFDAASNMMYPPQPTMTGATAIPPGAPGQAMGGYQTGGEPFVRGPGTGRSDDIPARLSDGEYVMDAETVALLGDGSGDAGAKRLDEMRRNLRKHKATNLKKGGFSHKAKAPHNYMSGDGMARLRAAAGRA